MQGQRSAYLASVVILFSMAAHADAISNLVRDAQKYADCEKRLDDLCILELSYADGYLALASHAVGGVKPTFRDWRAALRNYYERLRTRGGGWSSVDIGPPTLMIAGQDKRYAIVPVKDAHRAASDQPLVYRTGFLIAVSADDGETWMLMDAADVSAESLKHVIPEYDSQPLPPVRSWTEP